MGRAFRCASLRPGGRTCWRRVAVRGGRCERCWTELAGSPAVTDRAELAAEPDLPGWVAGLLAVDTEPMVRVLVAERASLDGALVDRLVADRDASVRAAVAANRGCPSGVLPRLAGDPDPSVVAAVASRPDVDAALLDRLAGHADRTVRGAVAANPAASEDTERRLACRERDLAVLAALAAKPSTAPVVRGWLARHPAPGVASMARHGHRPAAAVPGPAGPPRAAWRSR